MRLFLITSYLLLVTCAHAQIAQIAWDVQQDRPVAQEVYVWQGETVDLLPRLVRGTAPVAVTNAPVEFRYREDALPTNSFRIVTATANTNSGVLAVRWTPDLDAGAPGYDYQIIVGSNEVNPRVFGRITMRPTIGWPPSTNAPPPVTLYPTRAELQAASNALAMAVQNVSIPVASVNGETGNVTVTAAQLGAVTTNGTSFMAPDSQIASPNAGNVQGFSLSSGGVFGLYDDGNAFLDWRITASEMLRLYTVDFAGFDSVITVDPRVPGIQMVTVVPPHDEYESNSYFSWEQKSDGTLTVDATTNGAQSVTVWKLSRPEGGTLHVAAAEDLDAIRDGIPSTNGMLSKAEADASYFSTGPGWFWQGSQQVWTNAVTTNLIGCASVTNGTQLALIPYAASRHDTTGSVVLVSASYMVGVSYGVVTPDTGIQPVHPVYYYDERTSPTSWLIYAYCSADPIDQWSSYFAVLTNLVCYGYDRTEMAPDTYVNDAAGIVARVDDANVDAGSRSVINANTLKSYIDGRKDEIAKRAYDFTPAGNLTPNAGVFTVDEPMVQQGQMSWLNSGDYYCMSYGGGDWYSASTGSVWRIGPSGRVAFEIASTNRVLRIQAFRVASGSATIDIATNWVVGTPSIEFCPSLLNPQWISCPSQNMTWHTNYWRAVCPADSGPRYFRAVDPSGDNVIRSYTRHEFMDGITIGTNTFRTLGELKALLNALP